MFSFVGDPTVKILLQVKWLDLYLPGQTNEIANLISEKGINHNFESILTIDSFVTLTHPTHGNEAKTLFKMTQTLMMKELDVHISENFVWVSHDQAAFQKIRERSHMIWLGKYSTYNVPLK